QLCGGRQAVRRGGGGRHRAVPGVVRQGAQMESRPQDEFQRRRRGLRAQRLRVRALAVAVLLIAAPSAGGEHRRIRLRAARSNLPFSSQDVKEPGFEVEIGRAIALTVGAEFAVNWFPSAREVLALRELNEGRCDLFMGLPLTREFKDDKPRLIFSVPYYVMQQVIVSPSLGAARVLDDLRGKLVGVQAM